ncbi:octanoate-[acyl-carrier-protein]-protein-N-octan oyltransferase [Nonlabens ulvanivorans]|uniref:Octanoate-[acyl-carrier-protein]-protein-N-octan oyltransferase n=1 Tax=Nonlabens ulvanivorans TaxID=906888 RepID=A0A090WHN5_NONUL|nr:octanoate-[acyl-carrier-protein]-protein-N-octan oyltransferase [Nonlabens ulvanivorans]
MQLFKNIIDIKIKIWREDAGLETDNHLLFVEHDHIYTLGKSGDLENLLANESLLKNIGATFCKINCGGDITYSWSSTNSILSYTRPRKFLY